MSVAAIDDRIGRSPSDTFADQLIEASRARPSDRIVVAGADQLGFLITLMRRGFADVVCQSAQRGPSSRGGETDVLIAPRLASESDLLETLHRFASALRPRGVIVLHAVPPFSTGNERRLRQLLLAAGFSAIERLPGRDGLGPVWCAYKQAAAMARAA